MSDTDPVVSALLEAMPYVTYFVGKTIVIKLGGSAFGQHDTAIEDIATLHHLGIKPVLVHGGGNSINDWLSKVGRKAKFVHGLRVTDKTTLEVVTMVLAGKVNKELVAQLVSLGAPAIGLSGLDGSLIEARVKDPELGFVGETSRINRDLLVHVQEMGYIPVIATLGLSADGQPLNINADTAAADIAVALEAEKLIFLTDVVGVIDHNGKLIPYLSREETEELIANGVVSGGMIPKVQACVRALDGVNKGHIIDGRVPHALIRELFTDTGVGTMITRKSGEDQSRPKGGKT